MTKPVRSTKGKAQPPVTAGKAQGKATANRQEVRQEVHDDYVRRVDAEHEAMIWTHPGMSTYYRNKLGRVISVMPWRLVDYWAMTHAPKLDEYECIPASRLHQGETA